ncbi:hypothetical protein M434DRAFT_28994 [Hypoxylon sp. CO27-5]|nr:hypothetical protein M434DRAFT_28994 [Hypoxylon sp. CO27-5]
MLHRSDESGCASSYGWMIALVKTQGSSEDNTLRPESAFLSMLYKESWGKETSDSMAANIVSGGSQSKTGEWMGQLQLEIIDPVLISRNGSGGEGDGSLYTAGESNENGSSNTATGIEVPSYPVIAVVIPADFITIPANLRFVLQYPGP